MISPNINVTMVFADSIPDWLDGEALVNPNLQDKS